MATGDIVIIDGRRWREEDARARGLIGDRPTPAGPRALSLAKTAVDVDVLVEAEVAKRTAALEAEFEQRVLAAAAELADKPADPATEAATPADDHAGDAPAEKAATPATPEGKPADKSAKPNTK